MFRKNSLLEFSQYFSCQKQGPLWGYRYLGNNKKIEQEVNEAIIEIMDYGKVCLEDHIKKIFSLYQKIDQDHRGSFGQE